MKPQHCGQKQRQKNWSSVKNISHAFAAGESILMMEKIICKIAIRNISIPVNFTSTEFFSLCNKVLKDDGIIAMNIGLGNSTDSKLVQCLGQTLKRNVQNVYAYKTPIDNNVLIIDNMK